MATCYRYPSRRPCDSCGHENELEEIICECCEKSLTKTKAVPVGQEKLREPTYEMTPAMLRWQNQLEKLKNKFIDAVDKCSNERIQYVDTKFPPNVYSLDKDGVNLKSLVSGWRRPPQVSVDESKDLEWKLFDLPKSTDVVQGNLANYWITSAMSLMATRPELLKKLFVTTKYNIHGVYALQLCRYGVWTGVMIDDWLPCDCNGRLVFSQAKRKQLWVPILEKAIAKIFGGYSSLDGGSLSLALQMFTGSAIESISTRKECTNDQSVKALFNKLCEAVKAGKLIACSTNESPMNIEQYKVLGLKEYQVYTVLDAQTVTSHQLLRIRNYSGNEGWKGPWSENSTEWQEIPNHLQPEGGIGGSKHGVFWMSLHDFLIFYETVIICHVRDKWQEHRLFANLPRIEQKMYQSFELEIPQKTTIDIYVQELLSDKARQEECTPTALLVYDSSLSLVGSQFKDCREIALAGIAMSAGSYTVYLYSPTKWWAEAPVGYNFACLSNNNTNVKEAQYESSMLADILYYYIIARGTTLTQYAPLYLYSLEPPHWWGRVVAASNTSSSTHFIIKVEATELKNIISTRPNPTISHLAPFLRQVLQILTCDVKAQQTKWSIKMGFGVQQHDVSLLGSLPANICGTSMEPHAQLIHRPIVIDFDAQ